MRVKTLYSDTIVRLKDGRVCKILDVRYRPTVEIKALDLDNDDEVVLKFKDIGKILYERTLVDTVIELMPSIGVALTVGFLSSLAEKIERKIEEKEELKKEEEGE